jgi:hypothetical protein
VAGSLVLEEYCLSDSWNVATVGNVLGLRSCLSDCRKHLSWEDRDAFLKRERRRRASEGKQLSLLVDTRVYAYVKMVYAP